MRTLKVGIASAREIKKRTLAIARGEVLAAPEDPKVWFTSPESFARVLSNKNRELLKFIVASNPTSLKDIAKATGREPSNLSRTLKTMESYGLIKISRGPKGKIKPEVLYGQIQLALTI